MNRTRTAQQHAPQCASATGSLPGAPGAGAGRDVAGSPAGSGAHQLNYSRPAFVFIASSYDDSDLNSRLPFWSALPCACACQFGAASIPQSSFTCTVRCHVQGKSCLGTSPSTPFLALPGEARQRRRLPPKSKPKPPTPTSTCSPSLPGARLWATLCLGPGRQLASPVRTCSGSSSANSAWGSGWLVPHVPGLLISQGIHDMALFTLFSSTSSSPSPSSQLSGLRGLTSRSPR
ncbi:hypothetical protein K456DRAFT_1907742 [Colletotrichum gloeosporioides 23]|nr:hypothetical protein K456DRAFT_1907742 [Colletotrichum gloeosporioides 23]